MKFSIGCIMACLSTHYAIAQLDGYAWFQNSYENKVIDFDLHETQVWVAKPDYVMKLDTVTGETEVFIDSLFPDYSYLGSSTLFNSILVDDMANVYVSYYGLENGILKYDGQFWSKYPAVGFPDQYSYGSELMLNSLGSLFIAQGQMVAEFDGMAWQMYSYSFPDANDHFSRGVIDSEDTLWLISVQGRLISFYDGVFSEKLSSSGGSFIAIDDLDNLFIPIGNHQILKFQNLIPDTLTAPDFFNPDLFIAEGNSQLYCGDWDIQYYKFDGSIWYNLQVDIPGYVALSAINFRNDHIWFGSENGFLSKQETNFFTINYNVSFSGLPDNGNYCVGSGEMSKSFVGTSIGLFQVDPFNSHLYKYDSGFDSLLNDKRINCIEKFGSFQAWNIDTVWFGTNEGLFGIDEDGNWRQFTSADSPLPNDTVNYVLFDDDKLWIATNGGVACYYFNGTWQIFDTTNSPLPSNKVRSISYHYPNYLFATGNGVAFYNEPEWKILNTSNSGLIDNDVATVYEDPYGNIWFGTVALGICDTSVSGNWYYYNTSNGLPSDSITFIDREAPFWSEVVFAGTKGGGLLSFENQSYTGNATSIQGIHFNDATDHVTVEGGWAAESLITTNKGLLYKDFYGAAPIVPSKSNGISAYFSQAGLEISYEVLQSNSTQFDLFDIKGKKLTRIKTFGLAGKNSVTIPASRLVTGMYILRMQAGDQIVTIKVLKVN